MRKDTVDEGVRAWSPSLFHQVKQVKYIMQNSRSDLMNRDSAAENPQSEIDSFRDDKIGLAFCIT